MPDTAAVHVQARGARAVRVVELHGASVRIGRAAYCDVRIADPALADEECRLRRRNGAWQVVPSPRASGSLSLDGRPLDAPCDLEPGRTLDVGSHQITLRLSSTAGPDWSPPRRPEPSERPRRGVDPLPLNAGLSDVPTAPATSLPAALDGHSDRLRDERQASLEGGDRWAHTLERTRKWESRFRAAGARLRADTSRPAAASRVDVRVPPPPVRPTAGPRVAGARPRGGPPVPRAVPRPLGSVIEPARLDPSTPAPVPPGPIDVQAPVARWAPAPLPAPATLRRAPAVPEVPLERLPGPREAPTPAEPSMPAFEASPAFEAVPWPPDPAIDEPTPPEEVAWELPARFECRRSDDAPEPEPEPGPEPAPARTLLTAFDDDDFEVEPWDDDRPPLGSARRVERARPFGDEGAPEASAPVSEGGAVGFGPPLVSEAAVEPEAEPATAPAPVPAPVPDEVRAARSGPPRRWFRSRTPGGAATEPGPSASSGPVSHVEPADAPAAAAPAVDAPAPTAPLQEPEAFEAAPSGFDGPYVTDTYLGQAPPWSNRAPIVAATDPVGDVRREASASRARPAWNAVDDGFRSAGPEASAWGTAAGARVSPRDWPTVGDILAAQGRGPREESGTARRTSKAPKPVVRPVPTVGVEPGGWSLPLWLGWLPAVGLALVVGTGGCLAGWIWARDAYNAGVVAARLEAPRRRPRPLPEGVTPGRTAWWATTATHLVQWAAYLDMDTTGEFTKDEARSLLDRALDASPLQATARYLKARPLPETTEAPPLASTLGQPREVASLAWAGRRLLAEGRKDAALRAYAAALEMAARSDPTAARVPQFLDDAQTRRYALPTEGLIAPVVREMAGASGWTYREWSTAVPRRTAAAVVVARVLRERVSPDAEAALTAALADTETPAGEAGDAPAAAALRRAARAEALAIKGRWAEAEEHYREAVELMPSDVVRRSWWMNLSDIALRLNEESNRRQALDLAKSADPHDEITQRAVSQQKAAGIGPQRDAALRTARAGGTAP